MPTAATSTCHSFCSTSPAINELVEQAQNVLERVSTPGIRSESEKRGLAESWLELALSCAKVSVKYEADVLKQQQKQKQSFEIKMG